MEKYKTLIIAITVIGGMSLGFYLGKLFIPDLPSAIVAAGIGGSIVGVALVVAIGKIRKKQKKNNVPDVDERTWSNMKNFYAIALYFVLFGSMFLVCALFILGITTIELGAVSIYLLFLFMLLVIGTHIVRRQ